MHVQSDIKNPPRFGEGVLRFVHHPASLPIQPPAPNLVNLPAKGLETCMVVEAVIVGVLNVSFSCVTCHWSYLL